VPGIVAVMQIAKQGYPDPTASIASTTTTIRERPGESALVHGGRAMKRRLALPSRSKNCERMPARSSRHGAVRPGNRLSITPVAAAHWKFILSLE